MLLYRQIVISSTYKSQIPAQTLSADISSPLIGYSMFWYCGNARAYRIVFRMSQIVSSQVYMQLASLKNIICAFKVCSMKDELAYVIRLV